MRGAINPAKGSGSSNEPDPLAGDASASKRPAKPAPARRTFWADTCGAALVEFCLVAFVLLFVIFGTIEVGLVYWVTSSLENANNDAARAVRTGTVQNQSIDRDGLKTFICQRASILPNCVTSLRLDVRSAADYASIIPPEPLDENGAIKNDSEFSYIPGGPESTTLVSTFYQWPVAFFGGPYLLRASVPLRNEPF